MLLRRVVGNSAFRGCGGVFGGVRGVSGSARVCARFSEARPGRDGRKRAGAARSGGHGPSTGTKDLILNVVDLHKSLSGGRVLFDGVSCGFFRGAKIGVLGLNGAGKSSFLKVLAGVDREYEGQVLVSEGVEVGYLAQEPELRAGATVGSVLRDGLGEEYSLVSRFEALSAQLGEVEDAAKLEEVQAEYSWVLERIDTLGAWSVEHKVDKARVGLNVPPDEACVDDLSGGERRRVALCQLLLSAPDVLLLDEPSNHLDTASVAWLEQYLESYKGAVLAVTHDRYFLDNVARWILEVDRGQIRSYSGNYSAWLEARASREEVEGRSEQKRGKAMARELEWLRKGTKGRQKKSGARVAQIEAMLEEEEERKAQERFLSGAISIPPGPRLGDTAMVVTGLGKAVGVAGGGGGEEEGGKRRLFADVSFEVEPGAVVGVVGPNGCGKSTLMRMIAGFDAVEEGKVELGETVVLSFVDQHRQLQPMDTVLQAAGGGLDEILVGSKALPIMAYLAKFNLADMADKRVKDLSGGERSRVHLAAALRTPTNFLILDEPTNDLDLDTLRSLEEAVQAFPGCLLVVSHDRYFLDRVSSHTLLFHDQTATLFDQPVSKVQKAKLRNETDDK